MNVKCAITQFAMSDSYQENISTADCLIKEAAKEGAKIILLPELFEGKYFCQIEDYKRFELSEPFADSKTIKHFQAIAKELGVVLPISFFEKAGNAYFNSIAVVDADGSIAGLYRKSHIPTGECYEEKFYFAEGDTGFKAIKTKHGTLGVAICWDQWFPEAARIMALKGADILLYPTAIGSEPVLDKDSKAHWQNVMKGHAAANIMPVLASNRVGVEDDRNSSMRFFGSSFIADEFGEKVAEMDRHEEGYRIAEFDFKKIAEERRDWGVFRDRRTDIYGDILKKDATEQ